MEMHFVVVEKEKILKIIPKILSYSEATCFRMGKRKKKNRIKSECKEKIFKGLWKRNLWKGILMCKIIIN